MIDIETAGNGASPAILSIAALEFNIATGETGKALEVGVDLQSCIDVGLTVDGSTFMWWLAQDRLAQERLISLARTDLTRALSALTSFIGGKRYRVWANSPSFDCKALNSAYRAIGKNQPWEYYNERDVRTMNSLRPEVRRNHVSTGVAHEGISDCRNQIVQVCEVYRLLNIGS